MLTKSSVPSPVAIYGRSVARQNLKQVVYDGQRLPAFLKAQGGDPGKYLEFLAANRFGNVYDLERGMLVVIEQVRDRSAFSVHPEA